MHPNNNNFVNPYNNQIHGYQQQQIQNQLPQKHQNLTNSSGLHYQNQFDHSQHQIGETSNGAYVQQQNQLDLPHSHMLIINFTQIFYIMVMIIHILIYNICLENKMKLVIIQQEYLGNFMMNFIIFIYNPKTKIMFMIITTRYKIIK
uniref:Uncharacterized protein n=1 Tax=Meloidogyne enterolobii TaxID=390850 RepID=A0A6V7X5T4_MELEN|nr:unnamed protein product [Meloidogyne enterolobii]